MQRLEATQGAPDGLLQLALGPKRRVSRLGQRVRRPERVVAHAVGAIWCQLWPMAGMDEVRAVLGGAIQLLQKLKAGILRVTLVELGNLLDHMICISSHRILGGGGASLC